MRATGASLEEAPEREEILGVLATQIRAVERRIEAIDPDPDDHRAQRLQIKWTRTLGYLAGQYRLLMRDTDIDELEDDVEWLQKVAELNNK